MVLIDVSPLTLSVSTPLALALQLFPVVLDPALLRLPTQRSRQGYFCFIDYGKAFDCVDHPRALALAMRHLNLFIRGQRSSSPSPSPQARARGYPAQGRNCVRLARVHTEIYSNAPPQNLQPSLRPF